MVQYNFYATLLDSFQYYLDSEIIWTKYWGKSKSPKKTLDEFKEEQEKQLIDRINRVVTERIEAADKGTAFNEVVDCLIECRKSEKMDIKSDKSNNIILTNYGGFYFEFPLSLCIYFANYFRGAKTQVKASGILETEKGNVYLYGYIDELMPNSIHDIKTTGSYTQSNKFIRNWQHKVYPYCLSLSGKNINKFEYNITDFSNVYNETYIFDKEKDIELLKNHCSALIEFLEENRNKITDKKIFNK